MATKRQLLVEAKKHGAKIVLSRAYLDITAWLPVDKHWDASQARCLVLQYVPNGGKISELYDDLIELMRDGVRDYEPQPDDEPDSDWHTMPDFEEV